MKADELMAMPWRTGLRWYDGVRGGEYGWGVPLLGGGEVIASFRPRPGMTEEDCRAIQRFHEAAPDMARALVAVLSSGVDSTWIDESTGERVDMQKMARDALTLAGVTLP